MKCKVTISSAYSQLILINNDKANETKCNLGNEYMRV